MNDITVTIEIASVIFTSKLSILDSIKLKMNPKAFMMKQQKKIRPGMSIAIVNNDPDIVHLALPYYTDLESQKAAHATTEALEKAMGGIASYSRNANHLDERINQYIHQNKFLNNTIQLLAT